MLIRTRWYKILNDIWGNKTRSLLVVLSIAVGVGVVGTINNARYLIERDLYGEYAAGNPASVQLYLSPFQEDLAEAVEAMREVESVQAYRTVGSKIVAADGSLDDAQFTVVPDFDDIEINQITPIQGANTPGLREILMEQKSAEAMGVSVGDTITVEMDDENRYSLTVAGIVHNIYEFPYALSKTIAGYVSMNTLQWMGEQPYYSRLDMITSENSTDREHVLDVAALARDRVIEPSRHYVGSIQIPGISSDPGEHWAQNQITGFVLILQVMSVMAIFLSGGLVVNTISAILTQQVKQIGIMRSIGAVPKQIIGMYIANVLIFSFLGWLLSIPFALFGSWWLANFAAGYLNFTFTTLNLAPGILLLMTLISLIVPGGVALWPILSGTAIKIYDAIYQHGLVNEEQKPWLVRLLNHLKFLNPPSILSILNTFRNVPRLAFTLVTLTLAGATFVASFSTRSSLNAQVTELGRYVNYDAMIRVDRGVGRFAAEREALRIPGVNYAEGWATSTGIMDSETSAQGEEVEVVGLPADTLMLDPKMLSGRWLLTSDSWNVVVNEDLVNKNEDVAVGSTIQVEIGGVERSLVVVGITSKHLSGPRVYLNYPTYTKITGQSNPVSELRVRNSLDGASDEATQDAISAALEERFSNAGLSTSTPQTNHQAFSYFSDPFGIILMVLVVMAGLLALVGGLSLAGTMGINVMERTREIGVLRSVGAANKSVRQVVVVEGIVIALLSWIMVALISGPSGASLAGAVIFAVLKTKLTFRFSFLGLFIWLAIILVIGVFSSLMPARNAVKLTVREVLDYE